MLKFPENFLWGAATSAHQIEGGNNNDWSEWEHANSARLAAEAARRHANAPTRIPDYIINSRPNPLQRENYISGKATDHYSRFKKDFDIAKSLGHNCHRLSVEWSRIEPEEGKFNDKEIEHYRQVILALRERGIEPFVTLWHWPLPSWLRDKGGVLSGDFIKYFTRYTERVVLALSTPGVTPGVDFWITVNEPEIYARNSYLRGVWPPQNKNIFSYISVINRLIDAHKKAYVAIKKINPESMVGIAQNNQYIEACQNKFINRLSKKFLDWWLNFYLLDHIENHMDFIGLNYYFHTRIDTFKIKNENKIISDMGWELYPEGIYHVLKDIKKYNKPIYITENGLADAQDKNRKWFIRETLRNIHGAIKDGVDVRGYMHWSLLDNLELDKGFWPRFGLVEIDYKTLERKVRPSAYKYAEIIKNNGIDSV